MNLEQARFNMIEQQIRTWNVLDKGVLELLSIVKREKFLPQSQHALAFADTSLPLVDGSLMLSPKLEARIVQEVAVKKHENVLLVGAGTGYLAALLAFHARHVTCIEPSKAVFEVAQQNCQREAIINVAFEHGAAEQVWSGSHEDRDVIVVVGSLQSVPDALLAQLKVGGRLFVIIGDAPIMTAFLYTRTGHNAEDVKIDSLFETSVAPVANIAPKSTFTF